MSTYDHGDLDIAMAEFAETWSLDPDLAGELAGQLSCKETDALAGLLHAMGETKAAARWIAAHAANDEPGDTHYEREDST